MTDIIIQAATDSALTALLMQHGLLVAGEGGVPPANGVMHSHIGAADLDGVPLSGRYAWIGIDDAVFGAQAVTALLTALEAHRYTGPAIRMRLGGSNYSPDLVQQIKNERDRRIQNGGYQVAGKWFHSDNISRIQQIGLVMMGAGIPAGLQWKTMDGSFVTMTQTLAGQIFATAATHDAATFAAAEAAIAAVNAGSRTDLTGIQWPAVYA